VAVNSLWQPSEGLRARLLLAGWQDRVCDIPIDTVREFEAMGFQLHERARQVLPRFAEQRIHLGREVVDFRLKEALTEFDDQFTAPLGRLAGCRFCLAGFSTWMYYVILEDDRWLVLHGGWANCFTLPSTEAMLTWRFSVNRWAYPEAQNELFTPARLLELGVPEDP
jgi:hypothetical protein